MNWTNITSLESLKDALETSWIKPVLLFKHSTRCSISTAALSKLERNWQNSTGVEAFFIDLLAHRDVSNEIERVTGLKHESPQAIIVHKGEVLYHATHNGILFQEIRESLPG
ncbi:MAG: bacillithiol system redox-active protein YtxJ [Bacteroidetes bacterium]|nr:MAG: bacillithiol system redox-active protein YtxJ [Bacteroidota bacterium]REK06539.1 MAG: bacillithiol system redox-active protein YtxJ [Bacteroidota bacterium]REK33305.1 MAG: bacillithiol system redox-active protein YtxJ [Bacteroidota bacterium]REK49705.1 MAG: bacillithiol system redox-active protein YtxJ [Bacteroidota bacterium]